MRSRRAAVKAQRRTFMLGLMVLTVIVIGSVLLGTIRTQAAPAEPSYKYYTSIQIQKGDTLWNIADEYITDDYDSMDEYMEEICAINHIPAGGHSFRTVSDHPVLFGRTSQVRWYFLCSVSGRLCFLGKYGIMNSDELILCGKAAQRI